MFLFIHTQCNRSKYTSLLISSAKCHDLYSYIFTDSDIKAGKTTLETGKELATGTVFVWKKTRRNNLVLCKFEQHVTYKVCGLPSIRVSWNGLNVLNHSRQTDFHKVSVNTTNKYLNYRLEEIYLIKGIQYRTVSFPIERGHLCK